MITDLKTAHDCKCHQQRRRPQFIRTDQMRRPTRIGDVSQPDLTFAEWLQLQPAATQTEYYSYLAANPSSAVFNPDTPTPAAGTPKWLLLLLAAFGAFMVFNAIAPEPRRRR